jgi:phosphatidylglycerol---prolipoprotein diacylglyceryl transferase
MALEPLIPYLSVPELPLIPKGLFGNFPPADISIKPFGTLVAIGVYLGAWLAVRQGKRLGLEERTLVSFIFWVVLTGFLLGHVLDILLYYPGRLKDDPLSLIRVWDGLSSFGGFAGAIIGALLFKWRHKVKVLPYADVVASAFPVGWFFGRAGCSLAHDHPGIHSDAWFAVQYPGGARFDLGLYEMVLTLPLAIAFLILRQRPRPWGFYIGTMSVAYAPTRFALDFLRARDTREADVRYLALTPAQWLCFALLAFGAAMLWYALTHQTGPKANATP